MIHLTSFSPGTLLPPCPQGSGPFCLAHHHNPCAQPGAVTGLLLIKRRVGASQSCLGQSTAYVHVHCSPLTAGPPCILKLLGSQQNGAKCPLPPPQTRHSSGLINVPPSGFSAFHSMIYSPSNKFPPLSFTRSVLPFCRLIIHLAPWAAPRRNLRPGSNSGAGPRGHVGF